MMLVTQFRRSLVACLPVILVACTASLRAQEIDMETKPGLSADV
jgi:hypothetical protein